MPVDALTIKATDSLRLEPDEVTIVAGTEVKVTLVAGRDDHAPARRRGS
jgi:hypothetical protein